MNRHAFVHFDIRGTVKLIGHRRWIDTPDARKERILRAYVYVRAYGVAPGLFGLMNALRR